MTIYQEIESKMSKAGYVSVAAAAKAANRTIPAIRYLVQHGKLDAKTEEHPTRKGTPRVYTFISQKSLAAFIKEHGKSSKEDLEEAMRKKGCTTIKEAAVELGRTEQGIKYLIANGDLKTKNVGRRKFVEIKSAVKWCDKHGVPVPLKWKEAA